jgi:hypothetical protein
MMTSRPAWSPLCLAVVFLAVGAGCSNGTDSGPQNGGSSGDGSGGTGTGGTSAQGQGGQGAEPGSGGRGAAGGSTPFGGTHGSGGSPGSGGQLGSGGEADAGTAVSYAKDIEPLLKSNCTSCHGGSSPSAGIDLSSYSKVKANASAASSVIQRGSMPPGGPLSTANKQLFAAWVSAGTPNN